MNTSTSRSKRRVAITGLGPVTPIGIGRHEFWKAASAGTNGINSLDHINPFAMTDNVRSRMIGAITEFMLSGVGHGKARLSAFCKLAFELAVEDARLAGSVDPEELAVILGTAVGGTTAMEQSFVAMDRDGKLDTSRTPFDLMQQMSFHTIAHQLAARLNALGPVLTVSTGCTAGIDAVGMGADLIRSGGASVVVAGAVETPITPVVFASFDAIGALSVRNDDPARASRPFDEERDGFVLGEGACILVLEEWHHALARGAHIYAEVGAFASLSNAYHMTDLPATGEALAECMSQCLDTGGLPPDAVSYISAHGSSTPQNDICETNAIKAAIGGRHAYRTPVSSLKSMVGHALGASNAIEIAACALSIDRQFLLPTINLEKQGAGCDLDYVPNRGRAAPVEHILKLSSGFSGLHSSLILSHPDR
jgi:3-oxoacyl-(acyl-carrier-protein) synthase